ncbi:MAG: GAF domain-containing protein [Nitrospirae bacterium]|nr:GAF domain-containing protein [Nitrospirota bacterium]
MTDDSRKTAERFDTEILSLEILSEISRIAHSTFDLKERLNAIVNTTAEKMGVDCCYVSLLEKDGKSLTLKAARGLHAGSIDKVMLHVGEGINGWVAKEVMPVALRDAHTDPRFKYIAETGEEKYRSMLAVPITVQGKCTGVLTVQTFGPKDYLEDEITLLSTIASEVGGIIRNAQLYQDMNHRLLELTTLYEMGQAVTSTLDLETILKVIIKNSVYVIRAKGGVLRLLEPETNRLVVKAYSMPEEDASRLQDLDIGQGIAGMIVASETPLLIPDIQSSPEFRDANWIVAASMLGVPLKAKDKIIGTLTLYDKLPYSADGTASFSYEDQQLLTTIASQASIAIENAKLYQQTLSNAREMETLFSLSKGLTSVLDLHFVLDSVLRMISELLDAGFGILTLYDVETQELVTKSIHGADHSLIPSLRFRLGEGTTGWIGEHRESIMLNNVDENDPKMTIVRLNNLIGVPLLVKDRLIGTIEIANKISAPGFSSPNLMFLSTFAGHAAVAIENARLYEQTRKLAEENIKRVTELSILHEISSTLGTTLELDKLLHIILTGVTIGGGLGFNRAVLFLYDERNDVLRGVLGIGPDSGEEAHRIWASQPSTGSLRDRILSDDDMAIHKSSNINKLATSLVIPVEGGTSVLARTVIDKRGFIIENAHDDPRVLPALRDIIKTESFATAPLMAKGKVIGTIFVDNLFTRRPITEDDMRFLMMFANQAGLTIENALIYSNLEETNKSLREAQEKLIQQEKMAALGEMATSMAHEIRNPLVSIGGFARRLRDKPVTGEQVRKYSEIIYEEVSRLEQILQEILAFARESRPAFVTTDINKVIDDVFILFKDTLSSKNIKVSTAISHDVPLISADPQQLKQVFINLFTNAEQAMDETGGVLYIESKLSDKLPPEIIIEISNTGPLIPQDIMANIFNPFFTTKSSGTGLGLAIVHRIIDSHKGKIHVKNRPVPDRGVSFMITLPVEIR